jgi:probable rRNA maturation factor
MDTGSLDASPLKLSLSVGVEAGGWAPESRLRQHCEEAFAAVGAVLKPTGETELSILFTDDENMRSLNAKWRGKDAATNVLSFPAFPRAGRDRLPPMLGDIALAYETIARESERDAKPFDHHLAHLLVHGILHLLGYDHQSDDEAEEMEAVERLALGELAIPDPYEVTDQHR